MAAPTMRSAATLGKTNGNNATAIVPVPAGATTGDLLICHLAFRSGIATVATISGWTLLRTDTTAASSGGQRSYIFYRWATNSEPASYTFTATASTAAAATMTAWTGVKASQPFGSTDVSVPAAATSTPTGPTVTTALAHSVLLWLSASRLADASGVSPVKPASMTLKSTIVSANASTPGSDVAVTLASEDVSAGATGTRVGSLSVAQITATHAVLLQAASDNALPTASAGADQTTALGATVTLDGTASSDADGSISSYAWTQTAGTATTITGAATATATVTPATAGSRTFRLTVTDNDGATATDDITIVTLPAGIRAVADAAVTSGTAAITVPATAQVGDCALILYASSGNLTPTSYLTSDWWAVGGAKSGTGSTDFQMSAYFKTLTADDLGDTLSITYGSSTPWIAQIIVFDGSLHDDHPLTQFKYNTQLGLLQQPDISIVGTAGSASASYVMTAVDLAGESLPSAVKSITNAPNTLSGVNAVQVTAVIQDTTGYNTAGRTFNVYKLVGGVYKLLGTCDRTNLGATVSDYRVGLLDTGQATGAQEPPAVWPSAIVSDTNAPDDAVALYAPYTGGKRLVAFGYKAGVADPALDLTLPAEVSTLRRTLGVVNQLLLVTAYESGLSAGNQPSRTATTTQAAKYGAISLLLRPATANGTPTAVVASDRPTLGVFEVLDASRSFDLDGDDLEFAWEQTDGPEAFIADPASAVTKVVLGDGGSTFEVTVTDPDGASDTATLTLTPGDLPSPFATSLRFA